MRIAVFGDIHGNVQALDAVFKALEPVRADVYLCTGDVVGYGGNPCECIERLRERQVTVVRGNHDEYATSPEVARDIQQDALTAIEWTRARLSAEHLAWLRELPMAYSRNGISAVHSSHAPVPRWSYVISERAAAVNFLFQSTRIGFNGHSHLPLYVGHQARQRPYLTMLRNLCIPRKQRLLIAVGSVGQPRDGDPRACCVICDTTEKSLRLLRIAYDVEGAQKSIRKAGLPEDLALRLAAGR